MSGAQKFVASDEFVVWAQSLSGMLTTMRTQYGSMAEMVEHRDWDEGKTQYAMVLIRSLHKHIAQIDRELSHHVEEKFGKEGI